MNKKYISVRLLAVLLAVCLFTSCGQNGSSGETTDSSSSQTHAPTVTAPDLAEKILDAVLNENQSDVDFEIREKHEYAPASVMEKALVAKWISDFSDRESPKFSYSAQRNPSAEEPEILLFFDGGYFYVKDAENSYRMPSSPAQAMEGIPRNALTALFGESIAKVFSTASLTENKDGTVTATVNLPLGDHADTLVPYLNAFGIEPSAEAYGTENGPSPLTVSVTVSSDGSLLSYRLETVMKARRQANIYPVTYTVSAVYNPIEEGFEVPLPDAQAREDYEEAEPLIESITAEGFLDRFKKSDEKSNGAVYTEMITNATATYEFSNGVFATIPLLNVTALDLSKPRAPKVSIVETKVNAMGLIQKTETYYKNDTYYFSSGGNRFSRPYPAEEYLANVEASAKEKEESGISTLFLTEDMLRSAVLAVAPDQSVSAFMQFDGKTQEKNIFYHVYSLYGDDLAEMQNVAILAASVDITLDRFNYLRSYGLCVTVSTESNGKPVIITYTVTYLYDYDEDPREIDFPDDLDAWDLPSAGDENVA